MASGRWSLVAAAAAALLLAPPATAQPTKPPPYAQSLPQISPEADAFASAGAREVSGGDADADPVLAAQADVAAHGITAIKDHEAALQQVLADMPDPFVREGVQGEAASYRADSMADCIAHAAAKLPTGGSGKLLCKGNPYPAAAFYLGSYDNEIGQPNEALAVLDRGLIAGPNATLLIAERNAALIALHRWDDVLAGAARGLAITNLSPRDRALMLRNKGFALTELKRLDEAQRAYEDSLTLDPDNALAKNELRYIAGLKAGAAPTQGSIFLPNRPKPN
jgi:tetratricopeptide (TPR) repeat protein